MRRVAAAAAALLLLASAGPSGAQEASPAASKTPFRKSQEPIRITAKRMEVKQEQNLIVFEEEVVAVQGEVTISADRVRITTGKGDDRKIQEMLATGNVQFRQYFPEDKVERFATGEKAQYFEAEGKLILTGNPKAWEKDNVVTGEVMTFFTRENRVLVDGKEDTRVKVVFYPDEEKKGAAKEPSAEVCTDGADNDGDGAIDCADSDCAANPACPPATGAPAAVSPASPGK